MSKLSRRDFLKRIGAIPFMGILLMGVLGTEREPVVIDSDPKFIEAYTDENGRVIGWYVDTGDEIWLQRK